VDTAKVAALVEAGRMPIVSVQQPRNVHLEVTTAEWVRDRRQLDWQGIAAFGTHVRGPLRTFVAVSHVWADGLGNPKANALPLCQFNRIIERIKWGDQGVSDHALLYFWMDTFCIPVGDKYETTRLKAIDHIAMIYASAGHVLVLDNILARFPYPNLGPVNWDDPILTGVKSLSFVAARNSDTYLQASSTLSKILCSPWAGRSWTLQEAVLPEYAHFALDRGSITSGWLSAAGPAGLKPLRVDREEVHIDPVAAMRRLCQAVLAQSCLPQTFTAFCFVITNENISSSRSLNQSFKGFIIGLARPLVLLLSSVAAIELFCVYLAGLVFFLALFSALALVGIPLLAAVYLPYALYYKANRNRLHDEWFTHRLRATNIRQWLCLQTFRALAKEVQHMLHNDTRALTLKARGNPAAANRLRAQHFLRVWESLAERSTSKAEDVHYILGSLTHLQIRPLKGMTSLQRMRTILHSFDELPAGLLFLPDEARYDRQLKETVPDSMLPSIPRGDRVVSTANFKITVNVISLETGNKSAELKVVVVELTAPNAAVAWRVISGKTSYYFLPLHEPTNGLEYASLAGQRELPGQCGIMFCTAANGERNLHSEQVAVMFEVMEHSNGIIRGRFLLHVRWRRIHDEYNRSMECASTVTAREASSRCQVLLECNEEDLRGPSSPKKLEYHAPYPIQSSKAHSTLRLLCFITTAPIYAMSSGYYSTEMKSTGQHE
jgi:hypothetical protein